MLLLKAVLSALRGLWDVTLENWEQDLEAFQEGTSMSLRGITGWEMQY